MNFIIRKATKKDVKTIQSLNNELCKYETENEFDVYKTDWSLTKQSEKYFKALIKKQFVMVAETEGSIVGYLAGSICVEQMYSYYQGKTAELENMFIKEEYRKFGIGSKLIDAFVTWCKNNDAKRILVTATIGNENAIKFYHKNGFNDLDITLRKEL